MGGGAGRRGAKDRNHGGGPIRRARGDGDRFQPYRNDYGEGSSRGVTAPGTHGPSRRIMTFNSQGGLRTGGGGQGELLDFMIANDVDLAFIQEAGRQAFGVSAVDSSDTVRFRQTTVSRADVNFDVVVHGENPPVGDREFASIGAQVAAESAYAVISRQNRGVVVGAPSMPIYGNSPEVRKVLGEKVYGGAAPVARPGKRTSNPRPRVHCLPDLGLRRPLEVPVQIGGVDYTFYNYHAPQGGGSNLDGSGTDAPTGHQLFAAYLDAQQRFPERTVLVGDMNMYGLPLRGYYPHAQVAGDVGELLSHIVHPEGVVVTITQPAAGSRAPNSDHRPILFDMSLSRPGGPHAASDAGPSGTRTVAEDDDGE